LIDTLTHHGSLSDIVTMGIILSKIADISYNLASKYDVEMCKSLYPPDSLLGLRPWTPLTPQIPCPLQKTPMSIYGVVGCFAVIDTHTCRQQCHYSNKN